MPLQPRQWYTWKWLATVADPLIQNVSKFSKSPAIFCVCKFLKISPWNVLVLKIKGHTIFSLLNAFYNWQQECFVCRYNFMIKRLCLGCPQTDSNTIHMEIPLFMLWCNIREALKKKLWDYLGIFPKPRAPPPPPFWEFRPFFTVLFWSSWKFLGDFKVF